MSLSVSFELHDVFSKRDILVMGLSNVLVFIWTQTLRTAPFESGIVLRIFPARSFVVQRSLRWGQHLPCWNSFSLCSIFAFPVRGVGTLVSTCANTDLPYIGFVSNGHGDYPLRRHLVEYLAVFSSVADGLGSKPPNHWGHLRALLWAFYGSFMMLSTSHKIVCSPSSNICCFNRGLSTFLTVLIRHSLTPTWWIAAGVLNIHLTCLFSMDSWILDWSRSFKASFNSLSGPIKLVQLSDQRTDTCPLLLKKRRRALIHELVSSECATSMWTALLVKHVKSTPYLFALPRPLLTSNGPKKSMPVFVKGGLSGNNRPSGKFAIFCSPALACNLLHVLHSEIILCIAEQALVSRTSVSVLRECNFCLSVLEVEDELGDPIIFVQDRWVSGIQRHRSST